MLCWHCKKENFQDGPLCSQCQAIQPPQEGMNHFQILGIEPSPEIDPQILRERFLDLSKKTHPDRHATDSGAQNLYATRWTSLINKAHQTLKDPVLCAEYLLGLYHIPSPQAAPAELAESYFEAQEGTTQDLETFAVQLQEKIDDCAKQRTLLVLRWNRGEEKQSVLHDLAKTLHEQKFLTSMWNDLESRLGKHGHTRN